MGGDSWVVSGGPDPSAGPINALSGYLNVYIEKGSVGYAGRDDETRDMAENRVHLYSDDGVVDCWSVLNLLAKAREFPKDKVKSGLEIYPNSNSVARYLGLRLGLRNFGKPKGISLWGWEIMIPYVEYKPR